MAPQQFTHHQFRQQLVQLVKVARVVTGEAGLAAPVVQAVILGGEEERPAKPR